MAKFTFKTIKPTGKWKSFETPEYNINIKKVNVGCFYEQGKRWIVNFKETKKDIMEDGNPNCKWKWTKFNIDFESLEDAKKYVNDNCDKIIEIYNIFKDDK